MNNELYYETDNRDFATTWLVLLSGNYVEVDPWDLVVNALENLPDEMRPHRWIDSLQELKHQVKQAIMNNMNDNMNG